MTHFLRDILRQPLELRRIFEHLRGGRWPTLERAALVLGEVRHLYLTGIGSSWHAALAAGVLFHRGGLPAHLLDAAELLHGGNFPPDSMVIMISRSGRSAEIVRLLAKARRSGTKVIGITNCSDSPLAQQSQFPIVVPVELDYAISVNTYSTLAAAAAILASSAVGCFDGDTSASLVRAFDEVLRALDGWQDQIANSSWLSPGSTYYFLGRGSSFGTCEEARLLWEEGAKSPATAMGTAGFRHGPQEIVRDGIRIGMWMNGTMREADFALARDLQQLGAHVMVVGQQLPPDVGDLALQLPEILPEWQFLTEIIPAQLAAERLARLSRVDCDSFRLCSYIVADEFGLLHEKAIMPTAQK